MKKSTKIIFRSSHSIQGNPSALPFNETWLHSGWNRLASNNNMFYGLWPGSRCPACQFQFLWFSFVFRYNSQTGEKKDYRYVKVIIFFVKIKLIYWFLKDIQSILLKGHAWLLMSKTINNWRSQCSVCSFVYLHWDNIKI